MKMAKILLLIAWWVLPSFNLSAEEFLPERILVTRGQSLELARNTKGSLGVDSRGRIHWVYGIPDEISSPPNNQVWYQWFEDEIVSPPIRVDNGEWGGGRHPSLIIDSHDAVHVVWQDYRHTTAIDNYMDNVEIYYDRKSAEGSFSDQDVRLTTTVAEHNGDNGYLPKIVVDSQDRLYVTWYDFTRNGNNADIYLIRSDESQSFPNQVGIEDFRITSVEEDPNQYTSNWMPDIAYLSNSSVYVVWGFLRGWQGAFELQGCRVDDLGVPSSLVSVAEKEGRFYDPVRLLSDEEGNLGLLSSIYVNGQYQIHFRYKPLEGGWQEPIQINDGTYDASQPCGVFCSTEEFAVVWQEEKGGWNQVQFSSLNPRTRQIHERFSLSRDDRDSGTPTIAWNSIAKRLAAAWIERGYEGDLSILFRMNKNTSVQEWILHP